MEHAGVVQRRHVGGVQTMRLSEVLRVRHAGQVQRMQHAEEVQRMRHAGLLQRVL